MNEWMVGWMDEWTNKWMNECHQQKEHTMLSEPVLLVLVNLCYLFLPIVFFIHVYITFMYHLQKQRASLFIRYCINCIMWNT